MARVSLYTDGACSHNPGPGGWGCVLVNENSARKMSGFEASTTNNRMELTAVIRGLEALRLPCEVLVVTDSQYVKNAFTEGWLEGWQNKGWKTRNGEPVKNRELWMELIRLSRQHVLTWEWVQGHSGHALNEICDRLARDAIGRKSGVDEKGSWEAVLRVSRQDFMAAPRGRASK